MAKSAVRALDAMQEFIHEKTGVFPLKAGVVGASKVSLTRLNTLRSIRAVESKVK